MTTTTRETRPASNKPRYTVCEGNEAAAIGVGLARPDVVAVYPITPQSSLVEHLSQMIADGRLQADLMNVEGEHAVMSGLQGVALAGGRTFTPAKRVRIPHAAPDCSRRLTEMAPVYETGKV